MHINTLLYIIYTHNVNVLYTWPLYSGYICIYKQAIAKLAVYLV